MINGIFHVKYNDHPLYQAEMRGHNIFSREQEHFRDSSGISYRPKQKVFFKSVPGFCECYASGMEQRSGTVTGRSAGAT